MALIDLKQISKLKSQASVQHAFINSYCYNSKERSSKLTDDLFIYGIKAYKQAKNLKKQLTRLHQVCTDYVANNFQPYIDEHLEDDDDKPFDPINELLWCFKSGTIYDLPQYIEQYTELLAMSRQFSVIQDRLRKGRQTSFPDLEPLYPAVDEEGETTLIPLSQLPEDQYTNIVVSNEIAEIEVDYSLDRYDEFYQKAFLSILTHMGQNGDVQRCAAEILQLFKTST